MFTVDRVLLRFDRAFTTNVHVSPLTVFWTSWHLNDGQNHRRNPFLGAVIRYPKWAHKLNVKKKSVSSARDVFVVVKCGLRELALSRPPVTPSNDFVRCRRVCRHLLETLPSPQI
jgi:hypothetical protein